VNLKENIDLTAKEIIEFHNLVFLLYSLNFNTQINEIMGIN